MWKVEKRHGKFGKTCLNYWSISTSPKGGRKQVSGRVSAPCWHATLVDASWKPFVIGKGLILYQGHDISVNSKKLASTIGAYKSSPNRHVTRCSDGYAIPAGMPNPFQIRHGNHSYFV